jgi:hypothetical protein
MPTGSYFGLTPEAGADQPGAPINPAPINPGADQPELVP